MGDERARPARRWLLRIVVGVIVSGALLGVLLTQVDVRRVGAVLAGMRADMLLAGFFVYVVLGIVRAVRVRLLIPNAPLSSFYAITSVHQLLLRILPMRTGELGFAWLMRRSGGAGFAQSLVGLILLRVLDVTTIFVIYAVAALAFERMHGSARSTLAIVALTLAGIALALSARALLGLAHRIVDRVVVALRLHRFGTIDRIRGALADAVAWSATLPRRVLWQATALTFVQWLVAFFFVFVLALAARLDVTASQATLGGVGTVLGSMVPLPGIGTFGGLEAGWAAGFSLAGVPREDAIASAFGYSVASLVYSVATALPGWIWLELRARPKSEHPP
jgi:glycosyltransferase 2 family protein